jgi:hypothetical protein
MATNDHTDIASAPRELHNGVCESEHFPSSTTIRRDQLTHLEEAATALSIVTGILRRDHCEAAVAGDGSPTGPLLNMRDRDGLHIAAELLARDIGALVEHFHVPAR